MAKRARLDEALASLYEDDRALWKQAVQYAGPTKRHADEQQRLRNLGLAMRAEAAEGDAPGSRLLAKRRARLMARTRLATLFPRELRAPTLTPPAHGWPAYVPDEE